MMRPHLDSEPSGAIGRERFHRFDGRFDGLQDRQSFRVQVLNLDDATKPGTFGYP